MLAVPGDLSRGLPIQAKEETCCGTLHKPLILPHHPRDIVPTAELIAETIALDVEKNPTHTSQRLGSEELDLRVWLVGVHEPSRMNLDPLEVHSVSTNAHGHLQPIACAVLSVRGGEMCEIGAMLVEERVSSEIGSKTASRYDHGAVLLDDLSFGIHALHANHVAAAVCKELLRLCLEHDPRAVRFLSGVLKPFHQSVGDGHAWETLLAAVRPRVRMPTQPRDEAQIEAKLVHEPVNRWCAFTREHTDQIGSLGTATHGVLCESLGAVGDAQSALGLREGTVDATGRLRAVTTKKTALVHDKHLDTALHDGVRGREASQTTTNHDHLLHCRDRYTQEISSRS
mmetsp:Transcript_23898/g.62788  ORF Transcript_23898/g.62788 Transcript_23898/m.62788 type:complete len:342 (+) Transcript_23898:611-1636(+)